MKLLFASSNKHKADEIRKMLPARFELLTLADLNLQEDIPETANTLEGNAVLKANFITQRFGIDCFADDSGLEVSALNDEPGVHSARYAGEHRNDADNIRKVLTKLKGATDRQARFRTVIALNLNGEQHLFEGTVDGQILTEPRGTEGFGYDPIFQPEEENRTFAEMSMDEKNAHSHRARALKKMMDFLASR